ncbi:hypothetical protein ACHAWF_009808 [Thalassiosira exigua]
MAEPKAASPFSFPEADRHSVILSDGRTLSYRTFRCSTSEDEQATAPNKQLQHHPVLYLHGFPGSGLEGGACAKQVHEAGGQLFGVDRPGFGYSDPYPSNINEQGADAQLDCVCDSIWELIGHLQWKSFSIIGVSGGGPYALAMLKSYLDRQNRGGAAAKLEAISIVAGIFAPAGCEDMMETNQKLYRAVNDRREWTLWAVFTAQSFLLKLLPASIALKMMPTSQLPPADKELMDDPVVANWFYNVGAEAMRQGSSAALTEAFILFRKEYGQLEESLKAYFADSPQQLPPVSIFQGSEDVNVPTSHSVHVHDQVLHKRSKLHTYDGLGHASLVGLKAEDYSRAAIPTTTNN